jgi:predicted GH43/DUF377 family glycosyl hydrolase
MCAHISLLVLPVCCLHVLGRAQTTPCPVIELVGPAKPIMQSAHLSQWDSGGMVPGAVLHEGRRWRMFYAASRAKLPSGTDQSSQMEWAKGNISIGAAVSDDLVRWERAPRNPILSPRPTAWDSKNVMARAAIKDGSGYRLWYHGEGKPILPGLAIGADGVRFDRRPAGPVMRPTPGGFDAEVIGDFSIFPKDGVLYMFYNGYGPYDNGRYARNEKHHRIGLAISLDGVHWFKYSGNPILDLGEPGEWDSQETLFPTVMTFEGGYLMRYMGLGQPWAKMHEGGRMRTGLAWSDDLINWQRCASNPLDDDAVWGAVIFPAGRSLKAVVGGNGEMEMFDVAIRASQQNLKR